MSAQSINNIGMCGELSNSIDMTIIHISSDLLNYNDYGIGCEPNINDYNELIRLRSIICNKCITDYNYKNIKDRIITLNLKYN